MRAYRYIIFAALCAVGIILTTAELVTKWTLIGDNFPTLQFRFTEKNRELAIDQLNILSERFGTDFFIVDSLADEERTIHYTIYCSNGASKVIHAKWKLQETFLRDSIAGRYVYSFRLLPSDEGKHDLLYFHDIAFIGSDDSISLLCRDFKDYSDLNFEPGVCSELKAGLTDKNSLSLDYSQYIWIGIALLTAIMSVLETAVFRKEAVIRLISGSSLGKVILCRIAVDAICYSALLCAVSFVLVKLKFSSLAVVCAFIMFGGLMAATVLIYLSLYLSNIRAVFANVNQGIKTLYLNWFIKAILITAFIFLCLNTYKMISENKLGSDTEDIISNYFDGYFYTDVSMADIKSSADGINPNEIKNAIYRIYREHYYDLKPIKLSGSEDTTSAQTFIRANHYALDYLRSVIAELNEYNEETPFCLVLKEGTEYDTEELKKNVYSTYGIEPKIIYYNYTINVMGLNEHTATGIKYYKDPVITIESMPPSPEFERDYSALLLDEDSTDKLCEEYGFRRKDLSVNSVLQTYESHWAVIKAAILSEIMLAVAAALTILMIGASTVKYTFISRAKELCIMKISGHGIIRRYADVFVINIFVYIIAYAASYIVTGKLYLEWKFEFVSAAAAGLFLIDTLLTIPAIIRRENISVPKTLKGGAL